MSGFKGCEKFTRSPRKTQQMTNSFYPHNEAKSCSISRRQKHTGKSWLFLVSICMIQVWKAKFAHERCHFVILKIHAENKGHVQKACSKHPFDILSNQSVIKHVYAARLNNPNELSTLCFELLFESEKVTKVKQVWLFCELAWLCLSLIHVQPARPTARLSNFGFSFMGGGALKCCLSGWKP